MLGGTASQAAPLVVLERDELPLALSAYLDILADPERRHSLADITDPPLQHRFQPNADAELYLDFSDADYWLRFTLHNPTEHERRPVLRLMPVHLHAVTLYQDKDPTPLARIDEQRLLRDSISYQLYLPAHSASTFYLHLQDRRELRLSPQLMELPHLVSEHRGAVLVNGLAIGTLLSLALLNLLGAAGYRDSCFLTVAGYLLLTVAAMVTAWNNWGSLGVTQNLQPLYTTPLFAALALLGTALSVLIAIQLPVYNRRKPHPGLQLLGALVVLNVLGALLVVWLQESLAQFMLLLVPASLLALTGVSLGTFIATHSRLVLFYLICRLWTGAAVLSSGVLYRFEIGRYELLTGMLLLALSVEALILTALVILRANAHQQRGHVLQQYQASLAAEHRARGELAARIGDALRAPLNQLQGLGELLLNTQLSPSQRDYVGAMQRAQGEIHEQLEQLMQSPSDSQQQLQLRPLLQSVLQSLAAEARQQGRRFDYHIDKALPVQIRADSERFPQLIINLVHHALERGGPDPIELAIGPEPQRHDHLLLDIRHHGPALNDEERATLLHSNRRRPDSPVINLRLLVLRQLTESLGGSIRIRENGGGEQGLRVRLPVAVEQDSPSGSLANARLLFINRDQDLQRLLRKHTERWGVTMFSADSEQAALALLRNQAMLNRPIDLLLLADPAVELAALRAKLTQHQSPPPTLLQLTEHSSALEKARQLGVTALLKPVSSQQLRVALLRALNLRHDATTDGELQSKPG